MPLGPASHHSTTIHAKCSSAGPIPNTSFLLAAIITRLRTKSSNACYHDEVVIRLMPHPVAVIRSDLEAIRFWPMTMQLARASLWITVRSMQAVFWSFLLLPGAGLGQTIARDS